MSAAGYDPYNDDGDDDDNSPSPITILAVILMMVGLCLYAGWKLVTLY